MAFPWTLAKARSDAEIVAETNRLAGFCLGWQGYQTPAGTKFYEQLSPRFKNAWYQACELMELLTATDPNDALANMEDEEPDVPDPVNRVVAKEPHIEPMLDISTAHLSPAAKEWLNECSARNIYASKTNDTSAGGEISTCGLTLHGWFTSAPNFGADFDDVYSWPAELEAIFRHAHDHGCAYVLFDADAGQCAALPTWDDDGNRIPALVDSKVGAIATKRLMLGDPEETASLERAFITRSVAQHAAQASVIEQRPMPIHPEDGLPMECACAEGGGMMCGLCAPAVDSIAHGGKIDDYLAAERKAKPQGGAALARLKNSVTAVLLEVDSEIEQRQTSGNDEYWQDLQAKADALREAMAALYG